MFYFFPPYTGVLSLAFFFMVLGPESQMSSVSILQLNHIPGAFFAFLFWETGGLLEQTL